MNCQGSPIKRTPGRPIGFTTRGILFFLLALIILVVAALRMELAGILWGGAFSLLAVYCFAANWITRVVLRRYFEKNPDPVDFSLLADQVFPRHPVTAKVSADLPRYGAPGIRLAFRICLAWPGREALCLESDLRGGRNQKTLELSPAYRGNYRSRQAQVVVVDLLGFTRSSVLLPMEERLQVLPAVEPGAAKRPASLTGGQETNRHKRSKRSQELLEVRKYFPGDDIRKVHWKVFAHTSELFLRIGQETPPPKSRFLVILDTAKSPVIPDRFAADYLDVLVQSCAATVLEVLGQGFQVFFALCDSGKPQEITAEKSRQLLAELSGVWWNDRYTLELPAQHPHQVLLFSSPGSGNIARLLSRLEKVGGSVMLFFADMRTPVQPAPGRTLYHLLFRRPAEQSGQDAKVGTEEQQRFRNMLHREIGRWSRKGKVVVETL